MGENLTAVQTHLLVGEILDRITLPRPAERESESPNSVAAGRHLTFAKLVAGGIAFVGVVLMIGRRTLGATQRAAAANA